jgi:hypothetical protein
MLILARMGVVPPPDASPVSYLWKYLFSQHV